MNASLQNVSPSGLRGVNASLGFWVLKFYHPGNEINLTSIDFHTNIEALYEDVTFEDN